MGSAARKASQSSSPSLSHSSLERLTTANTRQAGNVTVSACSWWRDRTAGTGATGSDGLEWRG
eukprot:9205101-Alexandrium_andersonii.AAC.1